MNEIKLKDINFSLLKQLDEQGSMSVVYTDGKLCYKRFKNVYIFNNRDMHNKINELSELGLDGVLMPTDLIMDRDVLCGYITPYYDMSTSLSKKFNVRYFNSYELIGCLDSVCSIVRGLHEKHVVCQDLNSGNILVNKDGVVKFCDIDGYSYGRYTSDIYSKIFSRYLSDYRKGKVPTDEDIDRLSMFLVFYELMFNVNVQDIPMRQFNSLARQINTIDNLRDNFMLLKDKRHSLPELPYLDEFLDLDDNYVVDRRRVATIRQKILKKGNYSCLSSKIW